MKSVFMLTAANLRRHKGAGFSLGLIVLITAMLLNLGLLGVTNCQSILRDKISELHTPSLIALISDSVGAERRSKLESLISGSAGVTQTQEERVLYFASAMFRYKKGGSYSNTVIFEDVNSAGGMGRFKLAGAGAAAGDGSVYAPYIVKTKGYKVGDAFSVTYQGKTYDFKIAGFTEDIMLGTLDTGGVRFFLPHGTYQKFASGLNDSLAPAVMFSARTRTDGQAADIYDAVNKQTSRNPMDIMRIGVFSIDIVKLADSLPVNIGAAMEIAFAFIVALVALLVIRFRIANNIEQEMQNIGALKAVGYTSRQIRGGYLMQFLLIALLGAAAGIFVSYAIAVPHDQMLASETGLDWSEPFDMTTNLITLAAVPACVAAVAFRTTRRIRRLPVVVALRGGITTHSFRRNHLPLDHTRGPLNLLLAMKAMFAGMRLNVSLALILAAVSFASIFVFMLFYNFKMNDAAMVRTLGGETNDILIGAHSAADAQQLLQEIPKLSNVTQAIDFGYTTVEADGKAGYGRTTADFSRLRNSKVYEGRYPRHDNEAAIDGALAAQLGRKIGDTVRVTSGDESRDYMITGFAQSISTLGKGVYLTDSGMRRIDSSYQPATIFVYAAKGANIPGVMDEIRSRYGSQISVVSNDNAATKSALGTYESVVAAFSVVIFAVMGMIVILILALITGTALVRRHQELGIGKALGFTTGQLICQIAVSFTPVAVVGSLSGGIAGYYGANPLMSRLFRAMGIMKTQFYLPVLSIPGICTVIVLLTLAISSLAASRVRKISPCVLMSE